MKKVNKSVESVTLSVEQVTEIVNQRYCVPGGTKSAVMRDLFTRGYGVKETYNALKDQEHFKGLIYQMVRNYHVNWTKKK